MTIQHLQACLLLTALSGGMARADDCAPAGPPLEVLTLNAWGLPSPVASDRKIRLPLIQRMVKDDHLDIVGLQEVWRGSLRLLDLDMVRPDGDADTGLAVVTPYAVKSRRSLVYREARGLDHLKQKGALAMQVQIPGGDASWVVVTHLQAGHGEAAARVRASQVDELLGLTDTTSGMGLMMGDFNLYDESSTDQTTAARLADAGWLDAAVTGGETSPTYLPEHERFDRILLRSQGGACLHAQGVEVVHPRVRLSDHQPVRAQLQAGRTRTP